MVLGKNGKLKMKIFFLVVMCLLFICAGCTGAGVSRTFDSSDRVVTVFSGGKAVATYISDGRVVSEDQSDGWYFVDKATGHNIIVTGTVTIEDTNK